MLVTVNDPNDGRGDDSADAAYGNFLDFVDAFGPDGAAKRLRRVGMPEEQLKALVERFERHVGLKQEMQGPVYMQIGDRVTWYTGPRPDDRCWPPIHDRLEATWDSSNLDALGDSTTRIVGLLDHPQTEEFKTKGLVLGHVQSGKTTNFTGVAAKAADRGYRLFVVLAGIHNELRRQTQVRLVKDLIGPNADFWHQLTKEEHDFVPPANAASFFSKHSKQAVLCVIKKNATVLRKFNAWLEEAGSALRNIPAIVIDDEADQAAVATKTINPLILELLGALPRVAYVGYTATPFANLLINPAAKDLYPSDFIVDLPKPAGHQGTEVLFGREPLDGEDPSEVPDGKDMIRIVPDEEIGDVRPLTSADVDSFAPDLSGSATDAIRWFWLATAARRVRGTGTPHSTMLIHTSVRVAVHESFRAPLQKLRAQTLEGLLAGDEALLAALREQWGAETSAVSPSEFNETEVSFDELLATLADVVEDTRIVLDNSSSGDRLNYSGDPVVAIAVGGNTLSRGLTLEGLISSFFVRSTTAYDTLLQMGRWFGYREGYADLPRIWMTRELEEWFRHLAGVEAEIRTDIARYAGNGETPMTFAVRVQAHPSLSITSAAKMADAVQVGGAYGGMRVQTRYFVADDRDWLLKNQDAARNLVASAAAGAEQTVGLGGAALWRDIPADLILDFLQRYEFHPEAIESRSQLLQAYINARRARGALDQWNVAVFTKGTVEEPFDFGSGVKVRKIIRSRRDTSPRSKADIKTLMSRRDAAIDLDLSGWQGSLEESDIKNERRRQLPNHGLVVVYAIDKTSAPDGGQRKTRVDLEAEEHAIGVGFVFPDPPPGQKDERVYYSADLSKVQSVTGEIEEEDLAPLEDE